MKRMFMIFGLSLLLLTACGKPADKSDYELDRDDDLRIVISFDDEADELSELIFSSFLDYTVLADSKEKFLKDNEKMYEDRDKYFNEADGMSYTYEDQDDYMEDELTVDYSKVDEENFKLVRTMFRLNFEEENSGKAFAEQLLDEGFEKLQDD